MPCWLLFGGGIALPCATVYLAAPVAATWCSDVDTTVRLLFLLLYGFTTVLDAVKVTILLRTRYPIRGAFFVFPPSKIIFICDVFVVGLSFVAHTKTKPPDGGEQ